MNSFFSSLDADQVNVVVTVDRHYLQPLGVMLNSLLTNSSRSISIYLLHDGLDACAIQAIQAVVCRHPFSRLHEQHVAVAPFDGLRVPGHLSRVGYFLFILADILPREMNKALYLDPDLIIEGEIGDLWNTQVDGFLHAAVPVAPPYYHPRIVTPGQLYFNAGVMLINLERWRNDQISARAIAAVRELSSYVKRGINQDVINVLTRHQWKRLPLLWNQSPDLFLHQGLHLYSRREVHDALNGRGIIHFNGPVKPWHYACAHPRRNLYVQYCKGTPWEDQPLAGRNLLSFCARSLPFSVNNWLYGALAHTKAAALLKRMALRDS